MACRYLRARDPFATAFRPLKDRSYSCFRPNRIGNPQLSRRPASTATDGSSNSSSSSSASSTPNSSPVLNRIRVAFLGVSLTATSYVAYLYFTDTRASVHTWLVPPLLRTLFPDAEDAHHAGTAALKFLYPLGLHPRERANRRSSTDATEPDPISISVFDTPLPNPIGISAGLDKDAEIPDALFSLGAAVVEVGGCTPRPQAGNPRPRVFRIPALDALINRYGLNSRGADAVAARLRERVRLFARSVGVSERDVLDGRVVLDDGRAGGAGGDGVVRPGSLRPDGLLAVQIAKNKGTDEKDVGAVIDDYVYCVNRLAPYADVLVVNVSSPNTPGLRDLQAAGPLARILSAVVDEAGRTERRTRPRVMVKVSPDEDDDSQMEGVVQAVWMSGVDGVIVGNTTKRRSGLVPQALTLSARERLALAEEGGFSGPVMFDRTLDLVQRYRKMLDGRGLQAASAPGQTAEAPAASGEVVEAPVRKSEQKVIFATGGITNGQQALKVLNAGASVAMVYTGLVYGGSGTITRIKGEMKKQLEERT